MNRGRSVGSGFPSRDPTAWISAQRPPRPATFDPFKPRAFFVEEPEADREGSASSAAILLTNKECPWRCLMCDLWKNTTAKSVPPGAIPRQIAYALSQLDCRPLQIKLYNSGSFFDPAAIAPADYPDIARLVAFARRVVVESHPRLAGQRALRFRDLLSGSLEVAMGLETVHPRVLPLLNKKFDLAYFSQAAEFLVDNGIAVRAFVLVKPPFLNEAEGVEWAVKSAAFALSRGATVVSLIPTRTGNGAMERLMESGQFSQPRLSSLEQALELALKARGSGRIFADTWDLEQFSHCAACLEKRRQRIGAMNFFQEIQPAVDCPVCGGT
jgi:archaeosine synthase beta-subunit